MYLYLYFKCHLVRSLEDCEPVLELPVEAGELLLLLEQVLAGLVQGGRAAGHLVVVIFR